METNTPHNSIREKVTATIAAGDVTMRSPLHFIFKSVLLVSALLGIFLLSTVILNFILFSIRVSEHHALLGFGIRGWIAFIHFFPWILFFIDVALVVAVIFLLRSFRIGYKTPTLYLLFGLLAIVILMGVCIEKGGGELNTRMLNRAEEGRLPVPFPRMMRGAEPSPEHNFFCRCEVVSVDVSTGMLIARERRTGEVFTLRIPQGAPYATTTGLIPGDTVFIAGMDDGDGDADDVVRIFGIKRMRTLNTTFSETAQ
jgi:hypothetical protein